MVHFQLAASLACDLIPVPITAKPGAAELQWSVQVERANANNIAYRLTVTNLTASPINFEGRYAVLN